MEKQLLLAIRNSNLSGVDRYIDHSLNVNYQDDNGITVVMAMCDLSSSNSNKLPILELLLDRYFNEIDINLTDAKGNSTLMYACYSMDLSVLKILLGSFKNIKMDQVNSRGDSPLNWLVRHRLLLFPINNMPIRVSRDHIHATVPLVYDVNYKLTDGPNL